MKAYKRDFDGEKFIMLEYDVDSIDDFSHEPDTHLDGNDGHNMLRHILEKVINEANRNIVPKFDLHCTLGNITVTKCKDCEKYFITSWSEWIFMKSKDLQMPVHCNTCRRLRKKKRR